MFCSFVSSFDGEPIRFGKVTKQPSYRILNQDVVESASADLKFMRDVPRLKIRDKSRNLKMNSLVSYVPSTNLENEALVHNTLTIEKVQTFRSQKRESSQFAILFPLIDLLFFHSRTFSLALKPFELSV